MATSALMWSLGLAGGCQLTGDGEQAELQALLHDEPLQQVAPSAAARSGETASATAGGSAADDGPGGDGGNDGSEGGGMTPPSEGGGGMAPSIERWSFDDCTPSRTQLNDSSFGNSAFRAVSVACVPGVQGQGVAIAQTEDIVYVPDQPTFRFEGGVTVAGWFNPAETGGTRTLIRKRNRDTSSFALVLTGGEFRFVVSFGDGRAANVTAPAQARAGVFQHVTGTYDNAVLRLYIDGVEATRLDVVGTIPVGAGPLLFGNDGSERRFAGTIDQMMFATRALTAAEVQQLTCLQQQPPTIEVPRALPATPVGVPVAIDVALTNHNPPGACAPLSFQLHTLSSAGVDLDPPAGTTAFSAPVGSGDTTHMTITATPSASAVPGDTLAVQFFVSESTTNFLTARSLPLVVAATDGAGVR